MLISIVNPNSTASMTVGIAHAAERAAAPGTRILALTNCEGPPSIQGFADGALAVPGLLEAIRRAEGEGAQAHVIACFDDTGLDAARAVVRGPVVGIGEGAAHMASLLARRFAVVTTLRCSVPILADNLKRNGLWANCCGVHASDIPVLALEADPAAAIATIGERIRRAMDEDGAEAAVLGCAGMADMAAELSRQLAIPVVEGVACAVKLAEGLVAMGLRTSKRGSYA